MTDAALSIFPSSTTGMPVPGLPHEREYLRFHQQTVNTACGRGVHFAHHN